GFPLGLNNGIIGGFDGNYNHSGALNTTNPVVLYNFLSGTASDFVGAGQAGGCHLIGLASTSNALFFADLSSGRGWVPGSGVICQVSVASVPEPTSAALVVSALAFIVLRRRGART